jgi:predicted Ser/Thr protein kinase
MLHIYEGDLTKVFRHIQVERFFYSSQYRVGISSIDPQVPMDAYEKQITINGNYHKLPPYLHDINFHESYGELVEGNRGLVEYSDLLARPLSHIKQLLSTIERRFIKLTSSTAKLDIVYMATTDDKHMEAFHATPEFHFFKGRFEEITVPYLLRHSQEKEIYEKDLSALRKEMDISPYTLDLLVLWALMSRIKPCNLNRFKEDTHVLLQRLTPEAKLKLYEGESLLDFFTEKEEKIIHGLRKSIWEDGQDGKLYEGRFGPSPRDLVALLHKSAEKAKDGTLTAIEIFNEILEFTKEKNIYEFLQFAPQGQYHNQEYFLDIIKEKYKKNFEEEIASAMSIANKEEYRLYLERYIKHVVAYLKNQKLHDKATNTYEAPSQDLMANVEEILNIQRPIEEYRSNLLSKIAAYKIENPGIDIKIESLFKTELEKIKKHFFVEQKKIIESNYDLILRYFQPEKNSPLSESEEKIVSLTFDNMKTEFGYNKKAIQKSVYFVLNR